MEASQETLTEMLIHLLQKNHDDPNIVFARLMSILCEIRTANNMQDNDRVMMEDFGDMEFPELYISLLDISDS